LSVLLKQIRKQRRQQQQKIQQGNEAEKNGTIATDGGNSEIVAEENKVNLIKKIM
jgi:preprotein translocase subunit YajC